MYTVSSNVAYINGKNGIYDDKIKNPSIKYGRNAADNHRSYIEDLKYAPIELPDVNGVANLPADEFNKKMNELDEAIEKIDEQRQTPINFQYKYSRTKDDTIDTLSLMATSYEELGGASVRTRDFSRSLRNTFTPSIFRQITQNIKAFFAGEKMKKLEYYPYKLTAKSLDINNDGIINVAEYAISILAEDELSDGKIDGIITNRGQIQALAYAKKANAMQAKAKYISLYDKYDLSRAQAKFFNDPNNFQ